MRPAVSIKSLFKVAAVIHVRPQPLRRNPLRNIDVTHTLKLTLTLNAPRIASQRCAGGLQSFPEELTNLLDRELQARVGVGVLGFDEQQFAGIGLVGLLHEVED